jgi:hypothetical protein
MVVAPVAGQPVVSDIVRATLRTRANVVNRDFEVVLELVFAVPTLEGIPLDDPANHVGPSLCAVATSVLWTAHIDDETTHDTVVTTTI